MDKIREYAKSLLEHAEKLSQENEKLRNMVVVLRKEEETHIRRASCLEIENSQLIEKAKVLNRQIAELERKISHEPDDRVFRKAEEIDQAERGIEKYSCMLDSCKATITSEEQRFMCENWENRSHAKGRFVCVECEPHLHQCSQCGGNLIEILPPS